MKMIKKTILFTGISIGLAAVSFKDIARTGYKAFQAVEEASYMQPILANPEVRTILSYIKQTREGRFSRAFRWDVQYEKAEEEYGIPSGILGGLAMRESYGDPLRLNNSEDGGAGLFQFQPGTAKEMGLKVYGSSTVTGRDNVHGGVLRNLVEDNHYDMAILSQYDERFSVAKSTNAAAHYLADLHKNMEGIQSSNSDCRQSDTWDLALAAYNAGARRACAHVHGAHVKAVHEYQQYYLQRKAESSAPLKEKQKTHVVAQRE